MTREAELLIDMWNILHRECHRVVTEENYDVIKKAIKALEQEPCEDAISRQAVLTLAKEECETAIIPYKRFIKGVNALPSVNPQPKTGHWVKTPKAVMGEGYMWYCDKCEYQVYQDSSRHYPSEKYCPNCGCRMIEPQESESDV